MDNFYYDVTWNREETTTTETQRALYEYIERFED